MQRRVDASADSRRLRFLSLIDAHSHLCLGIRVGGRGRDRAVVAMQEERSSIAPARPCSLRDDGRELMPQALWHGREASDTTRTVDPVPGAAGRTAEPNRATAGSGTRP